MPKKADINIFESGLDRYFSRWSNILFWLMIFSATGNGFANFMVWWTPEIESVSQLWRGLIACVGLVLLGFFLLFIGGGLIRLRGSTSSLSFRDRWRITAFVGIVIMPYFIWAIRHVIASPLGQEAVSGWVAAIQLPALLVGVVLVSERSLGLQKATQAQGVLVAIYDKLSIPFSAIRYVHAVMLGAWEQEPKNRFVRIDKIDAANLRGSRSGVYMDQNLLNYFQETVLTRFYEPLALRMLSPVKVFTKRASDTIRILDIGGGEGVATANFIRQIIDLKADTFVRIDIDVYEGTTLSALYETHLKSTFGDIISVKIKGMFDETSHLESYDIIILLHSLYGLIDATRSQISMEDEVVALKRRLEGSLNRGGIIVGSLASEDGVSASFKRKCMMEAFGRTIQDVTFEEFTTYWRPDKTQIVDGFFKFVGDENGRIARNLGNAWIRYFARMTSDWLNPAQEKYLFQHLVIRCVAFKDLTEECKMAVVKFDPLYEERLDRTQFLPHKTGIFVSVRA